MSTVSHASPPLSATPLDESAIRHHERQLCATELLILAERNVGGNADPGSALALAATAISRREVA